MLHKPKPVHIKWGGVTCFAAQQAATTGRSLCTSPIAIVREHCDIGRNCMLLNLSFEYDKLSELENKLEELSSLHRVAFATSICERLLPNYSSFSRFGQANPSLLRNALDEVWQILQGKSADAETISKLIEDCSGLPPHEGDCETYVYEASMTIAAIRYTLEACLDPTPQQVAKVAEVAGDIGIRFDY